MIELNDDIFKYIGPNNPLVVTTNNVVKRDGALVMGAGIAKLAKDRFPGIDYALGKKIHNKDDYHIVPVRGCWVGDQLVIALQTKRHWKDPSPIDLVIESCKKLVEFVNDNNRVCTERYFIKSVYLTRPGCGNGGLDWNIVKPLISFLDDRFVVCHKE